MITVKESISCQDLIDMFKDYAERNDPSKLQEFVDSMRLRFQVRLQVEEAIRRSVIDGRTCHPFIGKIPDGYIQDFRHSYPFQDESEEYAKLP